MKFESVIDACRKGSKIRRKGWKTDYCVDINGDYLSSAGVISVSDILADDWEVVVNLRKFEFEGYVFEDVTKKLEKTECIIKETFGHEAIGLVKKESRETFKDFYGKLKCSKWKVIMEEIPNDDK